MVIDIYCHHISRAAGKILGKTKYYGQGKEFSYPLQNADPEERLRIMAKYGVDMQALSQTTPVLLGLNPEDAAELCRISNDDNFALCKAYPDKFVNICIFSLLDKKKAVKELDRAINELDCRGVTISSNQNGKGLDEPEFFPFYEKVVGHDLPILIHGTHWECSPLMDMDHAWRFLHVFGWDYDATQALWRLIFGGVIDRYPTMKIVTHHMGNYFPFFVRRIEVNAGKFLGDKLPKPISEYFGNIYGDTAVDGTPGAFPCGYAFFGADRMMYGSDYPFGAEDGEDFIRENLAGLKAMYIPQEEKEKILGENAKRMLKIG
ncbi:MAG: amidohydrolase family protein [Desulfobacterales bacterium]|nr:amidohydrolase family protein [Desulfobacterales bacterium]